MKTLNLILAASLALAVSTGARAAVLAPPPGEVVYLPQLPSAEQLSREAAAQGQSIARIDQSNGQLTVEYNGANGQTSTVQYQVLPGQSAAVPQPTRMEPQGQTFVPPVPAQSYATASNPAYEAPTAAPVQTAVIPEADPAYTFAYPYAYGYPGYYPYGYYGGYWPAYPVVGLGIGFGYHYGYGYRPYGYAHPGYYGHVGYGFRGAGARGGSFRGAVAHGGGHGHR